MSLIQQLGYMNTILMQVKGILPFLKISLFLCLILQRITILGT